MSEFITMAHGNGGAAMQKLIQDYFGPRLLFF